MADFGRVNFSSLDEFLDALSAFPEESCATSMSDDSDAFDDAAAVDASTYLARNEAVEHSQSSTPSTSKQWHRNSSFSSSSSSPTGSTSSEPELHVHKPALGFAFVRDGYHLGPDFRQVMLSAETSPSVLVNPTVPSPIHLHSSEPAGSPQGSLVAKQPYVYEPKPLLRKVKRRVIPEEQKTGDYWERRRRNNLAARRSREERRHNEIEVYRTLNFLQQENANLKAFVSNLAKHNGDLEAKLLHMRQHLNQTGIHP